MSVEQIERKSESKFSDFWVCEAQLPERINMTGLKMPVSKQTDGNSQIKNVWLYAHIFILKLFKAAASMIWNDLEALYVFWIEYYLSTTL